jgi:AcrR family transcriptional regulator
MQETGVNTRKRGDTLTESIYDAFIKLVKETGYSNSSLQQIAKEAKTSRSVLYRRWTTRFDLLIDIVDEKSEKALGGQLIDKIEDTGTLRGDLLILLTLYQRIYTEIGPELLNAFLFEIGQDSKKIAEEKTDVKTKNLLVMKKLLNNAKSRGENIKEVSDITLFLPFNLLRMENIIYRNTVDENRLVLLVDEILLPVFTA